MWSSEHVLKVVPNTDLVRPGYLYAFLSGRFGVPLIVGGTYGAIVQHIEPGHISDLPVPLAPEAIQDDAHRLVAEAAATGFAQACAPVRCHTVQALEPLAARFLLRADRPEKRMTAGGGGPRVLRADLVGPESPASPPAAVLGLQGTLDSSFVPRILVGSS